MAKKRRVLEKLIITEISGVDNPCQEGASVAILKRRDDTMSGKTEELEARIIELNKTLAAVSEEADKADKGFDPLKRSFEQTVTEIQKRDNCTATQAMAKARNENPEGFANYQAEPKHGDFDVLVQAEIAKGCSPSVAAQRVGMKYPDAAAAVIEKKNKHPFRTVLDDDNSSWSRGCSSWRRLRHAFLLHRASGSSSCGSDAP
jgi:hypothetical protein